MKFPLYLAPLLGLALTMLVGSAAGQTPSEDPAVEAAREAFRDRGDFPWYDAENDTIQRLDVYPDGEVKNRFSKWEAAPATSMPDWLVTLLRIVGWTVVGAALLLLAVLLVRALLWSEVISGPGAGGRAGRSDSERGVLDRVGKLPFSLHVSQTDLLAEARRCFEAGEYGQAIIYLYSYQLVRLDQGQLIRLAKGKTNRQYLHELRRHPLLQGLLETTMIAFEEVFFGHRVLERARFEECWQTVQDFHQQLEHVELAAS
jgi:hypothetical protein